MAEMKTKPTEIPVDSFLMEIPDEKVLNDCYTIINIMEKVTGDKPVMWGPSIIGFGKYQYKTSGNYKGEICLTGFSPRKGNLSLYVLAGLKARLICCQS